jgi:hypothetical protein
VVGIRVFDPVQMLRIAALIFEAALIGYIGGGWEWARIALAVVLGVVVIVSFAEAAGPPPGGTG